jgi:DNA helicase HerA-like ATPase
MKEFLGDVPFGKLRSGSEVLNMDVGLFGELIAKHIGVFAQTGGGKSNTMQRLIGGIMETEGDYGMLLFEPHGEYVTTLKHHPYAKDQLVMFTQYGGSGARKLKISYTDLSVTDLMNIRKQMHWSEPQERFLREAEERLGDDWFRFVVETPVDEDDALAMTGAPSVSTLRDEFRNTFVDTIRVCKSKLGRLKGAPYLVRDPKVSDVDEIMSLLDMGKVVLIDMASLQSTEELLLSTILASKTLKRRKRLYIKDREYFDTLPPVSVVLEEAQRVLSKDGNNDGNVFAQICNEGRKFKTGLMAITQQPKIMDPILLSQFNTLFILSLSDEKDFDILSGISKKPIDKLRTEIKSLEPGEAIITSPKSPFAIPAKIDLYDNYIKNLKATKSKTPSKDSFRGMV